MSLICCFQGLETMGLKSFKILAANGTLTNSLKTTKAWLQSKAEK